MINYEKRSFFLRKSRYLRVMKISFILLFLGMNICLASNIYSQRTHFSLNMRDVTVKQVFNTIEKNSEFVFFYYDNVINVNRKVSISEKDKTISAILDELFDNTDNTYYISDRQIFIVKRGSPIPAGAISPQQRKQKSIIVGKVVDAQGEPLIGASVKVKGTTGGTISDVNGVYKITAEKGDVLVFSYIGYKEKNVTVGSLKVMNVVLDSDEKLLDDVVVVGAGTQKKVSVTGAITSMKGSELKAPSSSLTNNLAGKLAGVVAVTTSGEPGSASDFYIRGVGTFGGRATPLILLDDVEISSGDLNRIPAENIESFSILKDASATAIYGARGANGVMLVTTKNGRENSKAEIHVTLENSILRPVKKLHFVDGATWMELYNEADLGRTPTATAKYSQATIDNTRSHINPYVFPDVDWYGMLFKKSVMNQRANINLQGGGSRVTYYMSLQVNHNTGILKVPKHYSIDSNINDWEYVFQNNIGYKVTPTTKIDLHMNAQIGNLKGPEASTSNIFYQTYNVDPVSFPATFPAQANDTHIRFGNAILSDTHLYVNPYAYMMSSFQESNYNTLNISLRLKQDFDFILKGLNVTALVNWKNYSNSYYTRSISPYYYRVKENSWDINKPDDYETEQVGPSGTDYISQSGINRYNGSVFYLDGRINYNRQFGDHNVSAMLMYMMRESRTSVLPNRNQGFSGRFTYDYKNTYLAEFNFGYNGTERLASGHRFEFFPAMSLGWVVSNEKFWEPVKPIVNFMKIRGSYGLVGSDETGEYAGAAHFLYKNSVDITGGASFWTGDAGEVHKRGPVITTYAVENACWERAKKFDFGVDMTLFNQLDVVFDYFHDRRERILLQRGSWPQIMGYWNSAPWSNIGKVDNKGFEISVNWKKQINKDLYIDLRGNYSYNKNKYVYVDDPDYPYVWQSTTNKPLSRTTGYIAEGLFKDEAEINLRPTQSLGSQVMPGDIKYRDVSGDGVITSDDQVMISPYGSLPRIQYGLGFNVTYKKFDFGVFFNGSANRTIMISGINPFCSDASNGNRNVMTFVKDNYWSPENPDPDAKYPRLGITTAQIKNNTVSSTYWMRCGNFVRFKTLEFGYSFPHCRIYFSGDNLAVWSPFKLWDPELSFYSYPLQRTLNIGALIKF
jgi:TonB-linked SusC/RagA family outer membrane protein